MHLHKCEFRYSIPRDKNRAHDGIALRDRFAYFNGYEDLTNVLVGPCTVLEMILALAIRCEETIMDNPEIGDRTAQWFWGMITNLGLGSMYNDRYDKQYVDFVINRFLDREYASDGTGGLFTVRDCRKDLRKVEIWYQLNWYLNTIV